MCSAARWRKGAANRSPTSARSTLLRRRHGRVHHRRRSDGETVRDFGRGMAALVHRRHGRERPQLLQRRSRRYGFEQEAAEIQDLYLAGHKQEAAAKVPDELLESTSLCGPEGYLKERIAAFKEAGVTMLQSPRSLRTPTEVARETQDLAKAKASGQRAPHPGHRCGGPALAPRRHCKTVKRDRFHACRHGEHLSAIRR